ncbi:MAG: LysM peptidoglycan-binding domain-containing protein [Acetivibrionales bacterium]|nr:LysM peptidoglycan-binding domain-containing protein [Bacillota bacterium]NLP06642.1 LysM peptidoglycan-binding domain-containing protein [Clostridiaceae bacterium]HOA55711.1 LysM peptidoglycan-binding domain-containing protein [Clostridiales bacterium]
MLPFTEGIVLGGSRARGTHAEDSDIDIGIYYAPGSFDLAAINRVAAELDDEHRSNLVVAPGGWGEWVNAGDWLMKIARKFSTTWERLQELNKLPNPDLIFPGQKIFLPE